MIKDEYVKTLEKCVADKAGLVKYGVYYPAYVDGLKRAIDLAKKLNEPKKVVIPEFIANNIEHHKYDWFLADDGDENIRKYIGAWSNGYEVEKEPKYLVRVGKRDIDKSEELTTLLH